MSENAASGLLPPNRTALEQTLANAAKLLQTPELLAQLWDAQRCPENLLPWLAWALSVDEWSESWSAAQKRTQVLNSIALHRKKGTPWAVKHSLLNAGLERVQISEHIPGAHWAQFDVQIDVIEQPLQPGALTSALDLIHAYKAARSHLRALIVALHPKVTRYIRTFCLEQTELVIYPRVRTQMTAHAAKAGKPLALIETQIIEVYPQ